MIVLAGQSNAVAVRPYLAVYAEVRSSAQGSTPIEAWAPDTALWASLVEALAEPFDAVVWWQGENNTDDPAGYPTKLDDLVRRMQDVVGRRRILPLQIVSLTAAGPLGGLEGWPEFRAMQQSYALSHGFDFIPVADIEPKPAIGDYDPASGGTWQGPGSSPHLTAAAYGLVAGRIWSKAGLQALRNR